MKLLIFPHSHFCEKARWALDYKGIDYEPVAVMPGLHMRTIRRIAPTSTLPVLVTDDDTVQGSNAIFDYLDEHYPERRLTPVDNDPRATCVALEQRMDENLGVPIRQILYASLLEHPDFIAQCFTHSMPAWKRGFYRLIGPVLRKKIYAVYVRSPDAAAAARVQFDTAMNELAAELGDRDYLIGDAFSRADLAAASLLSLLALPPEHPFPWGDVPAPEARAFIDDYTDNPVIQWVRNLYRKHRVAAA